MLRWLWVATLVLPMGCLIDGAVLMRPDAGALSDAGGPPDAGMPLGTCADDAGPPDAGPPDAGPPDAGPPDAGPPDAGCVTDPCATCRGCCESGACYPGTLTLKCGSTGGSCMECSAGQLCVAGACTSVPSGVDLVIEDLVVTDLLFTPDAGFSFDLSATLRNLGGSPASGVTWAVVLSPDTHLSLLTDELVAESSPGVQLPAASSVRARLHGPGSRLRTLPPDGGALYVWAAVEASGLPPESNVLNNTAIMELPYAPAACSPATCSGCCTPGGCVPRATIDANACGVGGVSCSVCSFPQVCDAGTCQ